MIGPREHELEQLKRRFPREYFGMQCEELAVQIEALPLQVELLRESDTAVITVTLNDGYALALSPALPGYDGLTYWYRWRTIKHPDGQREMRVNQLRLSAQLHTPLDDGADDFALTVSIDASTVRDAIQQAADLLGEVAGLNLLPLPKLRR